jgi:hypothetical protein
MIYITGDTHNEIDASNVSTRCVRACCRTQGVDHKEIRRLVVLGDFGLPWYDCPVDEDGIHPRNGTDRYLLKWYNDKPFIVLALMGNHDNYDMIQGLPQVEMFDSTVLKLSKNVFYLRRGESYTIEGKSFLVLGGAAARTRPYEFRTSLGGNRKSGQRVKSNASSTGWKRADGRSTTCFPTRGLPPGYSA